MGATSYTHNNEFTTNFNDTAQWVSLTHAQSGAIALGTQRLMDYTTPVIFPT
jgi:hypothetical protein